MIYQYLIIVLHWSCCLYAGM